MSLCGTQLGVINSTLTALEYMDKSKGGKGGLIVNISSVAGLQPTPLMAIYSAAKTGVTTFTRGMSVSIICELLSYNTCNKNLKSHGILSHSKMIRKIYTLLIYRTPFTTLTLALVL